MVAAYAAVARESASKVRSTAAVGGEGGGDAAAAKKAAARKEEGKDAAALVQESADAKLSFELKRADEATGTKGARLKPLLSVKHRIRSEARVSHGFPVAVFAKLQAIFEKGALASKPKELEALTKEATRDMDALRAQAMRHNILDWLFARTAARSEPSFRECEAAAASAAAAALFGLASDDERLAACAWVEHEAAFAAARAAALKQDVCTPGKDEKPVSDDKLLTDEHRRATQEGVAKLHPSLAGALAASLLPPRPGAASPFAVVDDAGVQAAWPSARRASALATTAATAAALLAADAADAPAFSSATARRVACWILRLRQKLTLRTSRLRPKRSSGIASRWTRATVGTR